MWIVAAGINLAGNAINAAITVNDRDIDQSLVPEVWDLMLFYCSRPRMSWFVNLAACLFSKKESLINPARQLCLAEIVLSLLGLYYMGRMAHFQDAAPNWTVSHVGGSPWSAGYSVMASNSIFYVVVVVLNLFWLPAAIGLD
jgi:hypothetical protein